MNFSLNCQFTKLTVAAVLLTLSTMIGIAFGGSL